MAISGTGTGPFTITGNETTLSIYNFVVAANAANATKNSADTQFQFNCNFSVGNGSTVTTWNSSEQNVRISSTSFVITSNATLTLGSASPARAGGYWLWSMGANDQFAITGNGSLRAYGARLNCLARISISNTATAYFEECLLTFGDSINATGTTSNVQYVRCYMSGAGVIAVKLGATTTLSGTKVSGATWAYQLLSGGPYTINDHVGEGNTNDILANVQSNTSVNFDGAYELVGGALVPRTGLISGNFANANNTARLRWKYNLNCKLGGSGVTGSIVRISNVNGTTVFSGQTDSSGNIPQQILPRVELINSATNIPRFPYSVKSRRFDLSSEEVLWQCDNHTVDKFAHVAKSFAPTSEAAGLSITGVSVVASGSTGGTVTITQSRTAVEVWQYFCAWIAQLTNFNSDDSWTFNGTELNTSAWNVVIDGATYTGDMTTTGLITLANGATFIGTRTDANGTVAPPKVVSITGITAGSRLRIYNNTTATEVVNQIVAGTSYTATYNEGTGYTTGDTLTVTATWQSGVTAKLPFLTQVVVGATGWSALVSQQADTVYDTIAVDGSTVTEFAPDYPNVQVDISDPNGQTSVDRLYSWFVHTTTTESGIRNWFGGIVAEDAGNFRVVTSILNLKLDNLSSSGVEFVGGIRLYRDDNATPLVASTTGGGSITLYADKVYVTVVSTASPVITGDISQVPAAVQSGMTAQGYTTTRATNLDNLDVAVSTRLASSGYTTPPTVAAIRTEIDTNSTKLDAAVSTRLAAASYIAPANADIAAIKAKTDNLPSDPADESSIQAAIAAIPPAPSSTTVATAVRSELATELARIDVATSTRLASASYTTPPTAAAIRTEIDANSTKLDVSVGTRLAAASYTAPPTPAANATAVRTELTTELARIDVATSTRLATASYIAPANADIAAIKVKTDNLPVDPASTTNITNTEATLKKKIIQAALI